MAVSIEKVRHNFNTDLARPNKFEVLIFPPLALGKTGLATEVLRYRCETAQLPGRHLSVTEQKHYGPFIKFPMLSTYNDIDLTFIISGNMIEKMFFDAWMNLINPINSFNVAYKETYAQPIVIRQFDLSGKETYRVKLIDAFPINVNQLDLDWSTEGHHKLNVTFAYTYWENENIDLNAGDDVYEDPKIKPVKQSAGEWKTPTFIQSQESAGQWKKQQWEGAELPVGVTLTPPPASSSVVPSPVGYINPNPAGLIGNIIGAIIPSSITGLLPSGLSGPSYLSNVLLPTQGGMLSGITSPLANTISNKLNYGMLGFMNNNITSLQSRAYTNSIGKIGRAHV